MPETGSINDPRTKFSVLPDARFQRIMFPSSYVCRRINSPSGYGGDLPNAQIGGGKILFDFVRDNKFKNIIDFGTWNGGSVICMAQALTDIHSTGSSHSSSSVHKNYEDPFDDPEFVINTANDIYNGNYVSLHKEYSESLDYLGLGNSSSFEKIYEPAAIINVYDKFWDGKGQGGNTIRVLENIRDYKCYRDIQFNFKRVDFWNWLEDPGPFDLLHVDISNTPQSIIMTVMRLQEQLNNGAVIIFQGGARRLREGFLVYELDEYGVGISDKMVSFGWPDGYKLTRAVLPEMDILTQEYPGLICFNRHAKNPPLLGDWSFGRS